MENSSVFLLILNPRQLPVPEKKIREYLHDIGYRDVQPYTAFDKTNVEHEKHSPENCLIVWRFNEDDKLSDEEVFALFGRNVHVEYRCRCPICLTVKAKIEHVHNHCHDREFGCDCITEERKK
jgi:hypothetical protein